MVRIVGGEILQGDNFTAALKIDAVRCVGSCTKIAHHCSDDDPRLQQRSQGGGNVTHEGQEARQRT